MAKPQTLRTIEDYRPALLWLMGRLKHAQKWDTLAEFERELGSLIPPEHRQESSSGRIHWRDYYVSRARRALIRAGLMASSGQGIWAITPEGERWLEEHPDGGGEELNAYIGSLERKGAAIDSRQRRSGQMASPHTRSVVDMDRPAEFTVRGRTVRLSGRQTLEQARRALVHGVPPEALQHRGWVVDIDGQPVGVKWLFRVATGLTDFNTSHARSIFSRLGLEVYDQKEMDSTTPLPLPAKRGRPRKEPQEDAQRRYNLLDAEIHAVRDFLDGKARSRPSDERLCYWVYLCLTFELHDEGWRLFTLIDPSQVPKTLYERTNRFAQACRIRAEVQT